jgi:hypothetical protein
MWAAWLYALSTLVSGLRLRSICQQQRWSRHDGFCW